ncbi:MAG: hypothetical protein K6C08_08765 [Oscillospiraceae bacterium]|nr:hypothetical protein [Oscillospiraceae bacterium]
MQTEIGGYLELERFSGSLFHEGALALGSGRACLRWLLRQRGIRKIALPDFLCDVVEETCRDTEVLYYPVAEDLRPAELPEDGDCWVYLVNYYGQLTGEEILAAAERHPKLIVDNAQAYFAPALPGIDTIYTCRKFLGVADGAFLYTDAPQVPLERDESHTRMGFVLGRFERPAGDFFAEASENNERLSSEPLRMSALTENLLRAVDYESVKRRRSGNFRRLHAALGEANLLSLRETEGAYAYPLLLRAGTEVRRKLIEKKIFVPTLWPNVLEDRHAGETARHLARDILPLPCDQRYGPEEMDYIIQSVRENL